MDPTQDPCQDFQQFACGGFLSRHPLNSTLTRIDLLDEAREKIRLRTKQIVDAISPDEENSATTVRSHIAKFLQSCLDERSVSTTPDTNMITLIRQMGGWEAISATSYEPSSWKFDQTLSSLMKEYAVFPFFKVDVTTDGRGSRIPMIKISPSGFGLGANRANYERITKPYLRDAYVKFINKVIDELKDRNKDINTADKGPEIFFFEERLLQKWSETVPRNLSRDHVSRTLGELRTYAPNIIWRDVLGSLFPGSPINDNFRVLIEDEEYFKNLGSILSTTRDDIKNNYMIWHFVMKYAPFMSKEIRLAEARFRAEVAGGYLDSLEYKDTFTRCLDFTVDYFGLGLAHIFRDKFNSRDSMKSAEKLFNRVGQIARKNVKNVEWLQEAKFPASDRLENLAVKIGYPDVADSDARVMSYYKEGQTNRHFLDNIMEQNRLRLRWLAAAMDQRRERQNPDRAEIAKSLLPWGSFSPLDIKPRYSYNHNQVTVPLGFLYDPIYSSTQNQALQLAAFVRVAQEAMKAIDGFGLQFRDFGTSPNTTFEALKEKLKCIEEETENELSSRGRMNKFVEEAISDIAGLRVALDALDEAGDIPKLPGLDYEPKQMFYIAYGQLMCERMTDSRVAFLNGTLKSAPERLRLHRSLQQTPDFADAFSCSGKSNMVARNACEIW
ncbi:endothelin-converting enzyme 1 [Galendromus occidentalis]|uniref:Endothelin-converting enzyme 1 n=1 Tax=Galendromus occidentalis TaxID=34638 RepID=A0AAJ6VZ66_9ACAR|nr:endothelin-converting enzyme 1 [Galendromus occidentalis]